MHSLVLGGLLLTLAILPLQAFASQFSVGALLALLFLCAMRAAVLKRAVIVWTPLHLALLAFLGIVLLQLIPLPFTVHPLNLSHSFKDLPVPLDQWNTITLDRHTTTKAAAVLASLIGYFFIATTIIDSDKRIRQVVNWLIFIGFAISLLGVLDLFSPAAHPLLQGTNFLGLYYYSLNRLTGYIEMVFPLPLALVMAGGVRRDQWLLYGFAAITIAVGVAVAKTTGGVFVLLVELMGLLFMVVKKQSKVKKWRSEGVRGIWVGVTAFLIVGTIISGVAWLGTESIPQMIKSDLTQNVGELGGLQKDVPASHNYYSRIWLWKASLQMIADHPVLGVGLGAYPIAYTRYDPGSGIPLVNAAHNDYLQVLCETGFVGGVVMIFFLASLVRVCWHSLKNQRPLNRAVSLGATVGCLGILVHSLVDFHLESPGTAMLFLMLIALLASVERLRSNAHSR